MCRGAKDHRSSVCPDLHHGIEQNTLIANIICRFSGEVVKIAVSASLFNPAILPDDETLLRAYVTLSCQPWLTSMEKKQR